jgi:hypothetical protein
MSQTRIVPLLDIVMNRAPSGKNTAEKGGSPQVSKMMPKSSPICHVWAVSSEEIEMIRVPSGESARSRIATPCFWDFPKRCPVMVSQMYIDISTTNANLEPSGEKLAERIGLSSTSNTTLSVLLVTSRRVRVQRLWATASRVPSGDTAHDRLSSRICAVTKRSDPNVFCTRFFWTHQVPTVWHYDYHWYLATNLP